MILETHMKITFDNDISEDFKKVPRIGKKHSVNHFNMNKILQELRENIPLTLLKNYRVKTSLWTVFDFPLRNLLLFFSGPNDEWYFAIYTPRKFIVKMSIWHRLLLRFWKHFSRDTFLCKHIYDSCSWFNVEI